MMINLTELFEVQRKLDAEIESKHPTAPGEDRLAKRILALQVELGELANEWRGFKFWSTDKRARTDETIYCICDEGVIHWGEGSTNICDKCDGDGIKGHENLVLNEYVDCIHFALSIGIDLKVKASAISNNISPVWMPDVVDQFLWTNHKLVQLYQDIRDMKGEASKYCFLQLMNALIGLGELLGFTWEQVTEAYMNKNKTNWDRQANGY